MLLITPPIKKMYMHFIFDFSTRSFKSASTQVVKTRNKLLNEEIFFNSTRSASLSLRGAALRNFFACVVSHVNLALLIRSILSKVTIFTKAIMHVVYPPKIFHNYCIQFLLGTTVMPREIEDNGHEKFRGVNKVHYGLG